MLVNDLKRNIDQLGQLDGSFASQPKKARYHPNESSSASLLGSSSREEGLIEAANEVFEELSEEKDYDESILSMRQFYNRLKALRNFSEFPTKMQTLWETLAEQPVEEGQTIETAGRFCWIQEKLVEGQPKRALLFRLYKDVFSSTAIDEGAYPLDLQGKKWYRIETLEYIFDDKEGDYLKEDPETFLIDMHIDLAGRYSGIDWIRKGDRYSGSEVKKLAMKISKYLGVKKETLCDASKLAFEGNKRYSMKLIFSLIDHSQFPHMSWYERDGFMALQCQNIPVCEEDELISQDSVFYYQALEAVRKTPISYLYSHVLNSAPAKKKLLAAYRILCPKASSADLINSEVTVAELVTALWKERGKNQRADRAFHFFYHTLLSFPLNLPLVQRSAEFQTWEATLSRLFSTTLFIRNPSLNKEERAAERRRLLHRIHTEEGQEALRHQCSL